MKHYAFFNKRIVTPIKRFGFQGEGRIALQTLNSQILSKIMLRRTKVSHAQDILLPPKTVRVKKYRLDEREADFYQVLQTQSQAQFNTYVQAGTVMKNFTNILKLLLRLRQAVDHPYLVIFSDTFLAENDDHTTAGGMNMTSMSAGAGADAVQVCGICHDVLENPLSNLCGHRFCYACVLTVLQSGLESKDCLCPIASCRAQLNIDLENSFNQRGFCTDKESFLNRISTSSFQTSTKIEALMQNLSEMQKQERFSKAVVFSQFVGMLDLLEYRLKVAGYGVEKLTGRMSMERRDLAATRFKEDPLCKVFLISLKAGGVALNLTVANHIFLIDPWWNPACEMQAMDRVHRIGQCRPVCATRIIIENSIEERILSLQDKKKMIFDGTVGGNPEALSKLTEDDLRFLFSG